MGLDLWDKQKEILNAFTTHKRISVKSGHKCGKSTTAVVAALWYYCCFPDARVVFSSTTARQVKEILWRELQRVRGKSLIKIPGKLGMLPSSGLVDGLREIKGFTARDPEAMAGFSGPKMMFILDEASGVDDRIYEAVEGNRAGGAYLLLIGNPTKTTGVFYSSHTKKREFYKTFTISSEETPNVKQNREVIPGLATKEWVEEKKKEWGIDSPIYQVRVAGNFPSGDSNAVIPMDSIEVAVERRLDNDLDLTLPAYSGPIEIGVDVARFGDDETVIALVRGHHMLDMAVLSEARTDTIVSKIFELINLHKKSRDLKPIVKIDASGGWGSGVADALYRRRREVECIEYNAAQSPANKQEYHILRDELWFSLSRWIQEGATLMDDEKLHGDLACPTYTLDGKNKRVVESKKEMKKRLGRSPDRADALALAVYNPSRDYIEDDYADYQDRDEDVRTDFSPYDQDFSPHGHEFSPYG